MPRGPFAINPAATPIGRVNGVPIALDPAWYRFFAATQAEVGDGVVGLIQNAPFITYDPNVTLINALVLTGAPAIDLTSGAGLLTIDLNDTLVVPAIYGNSTHVAAFDVDEKGRLVGATNVAISASGIGAALASRTITAGAGLTGGGDLTANRTLNVGAGAGITVNADDIALTVPTAAGTYTPTLTAGANVNTATAYATQYMRVGAVVTVSGRVRLDLTLIATASVCDISLPIASNFANPFECAGTAASADAANSAAAIFADATGDVARMSFVSFGTGAHDYYFSFTYQVI